MEANLATTNLLLGIMAAVSVLEALVLSQTRWRGLPAKHAANDEAFWATCVASRDRTRVRDMPQLSAASGSRD